MVDYGPLAVFLAAYWRWDLMTATAALIGATVLALGLVSLVTDASAEMVTAILPMYLMYGLGVGYLQTKRHWLTSVRPIHRCTHFPTTAPKAQILRLKRWLNGQWSSKQVTRSDSSTPQS